MQRFTGLKPGDTLPFPVVLPLTVREYLDDGYNRLIVTVQGQNGNGVAKIAQAHASDSRDEQFTQFCNLVVDYHDALIKLGVRTPEPIEIHVSLIDGKRYMLETSPFVGDSVHRLMPTASKEEVVALCLGMIEAAIQPIICQKENEEGCLPFGIDPIPRNFTKDPSGFYMVDIWPPKVHPNLEYPAPTDSQVIALGIYRHYTATGIMKAFMVQLCRLRPEFRRLFQELVEGFLRELGFQSHLEELKSSPANRLVKGDGLQELIAPLGYPEIYDLRDIACELAFQGRLRPDDLTWIFKISHFQDQPLENAIINQIKSLLLTGKLS